MAGKIAHESPTSDRLFRFAAPTAPAPAVEVQKAAMAKVNDTLETITKREEHIQRKVDNEMKQAKAFSQANKKREALQCLKRKKMYEKQLESLM